jgi:hypothetical protein
VAASLGEVAQEPGDHPDSYVLPMWWAIRSVTGAYAGRPASRLLPEQRRDTRHAGCCRVVLRSACSLPGVRCSRVVAAASGSACRSADQIRIWLVAVQTCARAARCRIGAAVESRAVLYVAASHARMSRQ